MASGSSRFSAEEVFQGRTESPWQGSSRFSAERVFQGRTGSPSDICLKLNDSVYELYKPSESTADIDILFFHGLHTGSNSVPHLWTWRAKSEELLIWPKKWLSKEYPDARILTISYDGSLRKHDTGGRMDLQLVSESLMQDLLLADVGQTRPVFLVGHSFGGIIIKSLCLLAHHQPNLRPSGRTQRMLTFLHNVKAIFYYGTPHQGCRFSEEKFEEEEGDLVQNMRVFNKHLSRVNQDFQHLREQYNWDVAGVSETHATSLEGGHSHMIVEEASARCENIIPVGEDHFSICQPCGKRSTTYLILKDRIKLVMRSIYIENIQRHRQMVLAKANQSMRNASDVFVLLGLDELSFEGYISEESTTEKDPDASYFSTAFALAAHKVGMSYDATMRFLKALETSISKVLYGEKNWEIRETSVPERLGVVTRTMNIRFNSQFSAQLQGRIFRLALLDAAIEEEVLQLYVRVVEALREIFGR